jgi:cytochrome c oxidase cbb3-type subunit 3
MTKRTRGRRRAVKLWNGIATAALVGAAVVAGSGGGHAQQQPPPQPPAGGQAPAQPAPGGGRQGGGRGVFPQQQRTPGDPASIERGRSIYSVTCSSCHGVDARGGQLGGPNLLRSQLVLADQEGEAIIPVILKGRPDKGMPPMPVSEADSKAIVAYLHYLLSAAGRQGSPPPSDKPPPDVLVGDATAGKTVFEAKCASCHSTTGDLQGIGARLPDAKSVQNLWVSGGMTTGRGGRGGGRGRGSSRTTVTVVVSQPNGEKVEGQLRRIDDFIVTLVDAEGYERSFRRNGDVPKVEVRDPLQGHRDLLAEITDKNMHDITAFLVTLK